MDHTLMVSLSWNEYTVELGTTEHSAKVSKNAGILAFMNNWIYLKTTVTTGLTRQSYLHQSNSYILSCKG